MIKRTRSKSARGMTNAAILDRRHVVDWLAAGRNTMAGGAIVNNVSVIYECSAEAFGVMTEATIGGSCQVCGHSGRFAGRANTVVVVVT